MFLGADFAPALAGNCGARAVPAESGLLGFPRCSCAWSLWYSRRSAVWFLVRSYACWCWRLSSGLTGVLCVVGFGPRSGLGCLVVRGLALLVCWVLALLFLFFCCRRSMVYWKVCLSPVRIPTMPGNRGRSSRRFTASWLNLADRQVADLVQFLPRREPPSKAHYPVAIDAYWLISAKRGKT